MGKEPVLRAFHQVVSVHRVLSLHFQRRHEAFLVSRDETDQPEVVLGPALVGR